MILYHTVPVFKYSLEMGHGSTDLGAESDMGMGRIGSTGRVSVGEEAAARQRAAAGSSFVEGHDFLVAPAAAASITATTATAAGASASTAEASAAAFTLGFGPRLAHGDGFAAELAAVELGDGVTGAVLALHLDKTETLALAGIAVLDDRHRGDLAGHGKIMIEVRFRDFDSQVAYIQFLVHGVFLSMLVFIRAVPYRRARAGENAHACKPG
jgi:hypothetical protein